MKKTALTLLILLPTFCLADAGNPDLQTYVDHWRTEHHVPGMALTVYPLGEKMLTITSGKKQLDSAAPVTANTFFQIGSITKTFTAAAILKLESQNKLSINDPIGKWFPQYPRWKNITIKQLLNMTSGLEKYENNPDFDPEETWDPEELLALAYAQPDFSPPEKEWHYSNTNYVLLGEIIEKVRHQSLDEALNTYFYTKYHLNHTLVMSPIYESAVTKFMAHGYKNDKDITAYSMTAFGAAGNMVSTSQDIAKWVDALFNGNALPPKQLKELLTTVSFDAPPKPKNSRYGLGLYYSYSEKYGDIWWYSGVTNGYISLFMYLPKEKLIVTSNINRIQGEDYWSLMPNQEFVKGLLPMVVTQSTPEIETKSEAEIVPETKTT